MTRDALGSESNPKSSASASFATRARQDYRTLEGRDYPDAEATLPRTLPRSTCVYCGERDATTEDHIPPKCLFGLPLPSTLIKVPSCFQCNSTSRDDEYFRIALSSRHDIDHRDTALGAPDRRRRGH